MRWFAGIGTAVSVAYWLGVFWLILGAAEAPPMRTFVAAMAVFAFGAWASARWLVR